MNYCKRCENEIKDINLQEEQKLEIWRMKASEMALFGMKKIQDSGNLNLEESKVIFNHVNIEYGQCIRCNYFGLNIENIECPKCKAFNLNWKINQSFNYKFCISLEYKLCKAFEHSGDMELRRFGCDGVNHVPDNIKEISIRNIGENKLIKTKAWLGYSGQDKYEMIIKLGRKSLKNYINKLSIIEYIPSRNIKDWMHLDIENKMIEIELD